MYQPYCEVVQRGQHFADVERSVARCQHLARKIHGGCFTLRLVTSQPHFACSSRQRTDHSENLKADGRSGEQAMKLLPRSARGNRQCFGGVLNHSDSQRVRSMLGIFYADTFFTHRLQGPNRVQDERRGNGGALIQVIVLTQQGLND